MTTHAQALISLCGVHKRFADPFGLLSALAYHLGAGPGPRIAKAVTDVNFDLHRGETLALVGESGCGKSTIGRLVSGLTAPSEGVVYYRGRDLSNLKATDRNLAYLATQMIFQNPFASVNPRMRIRDIIGQAPKIHKITTPDEHDDYIDNLMLQVGLNPADKTRFPHQFSGGQRQRIGIARALAVKPDILICDEAVAALDVSIQAQILNLLSELKEQRNLTFLFISHDLSVVRHIADRVAVMYAGRIVEIGTAADVFSYPQHPYTRALINEAPRIDIRSEASIPLFGEIPSPFALPPGCAFHPRCPQAEEKCSTERPILHPVSEVAAACHFTTPPPA